MKILIADDDEVYVDLMADYLSHYEEKNLPHEITKISDEHQLLTEIKINKYDIVFLDIRIGDANGIDIAKLLYASNPNVVISFVTSYYQYVHSAFDLKACNFIHKPFQESEFRSVYYQALESYQRKNSCCIFNTSEGKLAFNPYDIRYVESYYTNLKIATKKESYYSNVKNAKAIKSALITFDFMQIHQSYFVNFNHGLRIKGDSFIMKNGEELPISPSRKAEVVKAFHKFLVRGD